jgi:hypothetical protein
VTSFDELVAEARAAPFSGWDFSWLDARSTTAGLPWDYVAEGVARRGRVAMADDRAAVPGHRRQAARMTARGVRVDK